MVQDCKCGHFLFKITFDITDNGFADGKGK